MKRDSVRATAFGLWAMCFYSLVTASLVPTMNWQATVLLSTLTAAIAGILLMLPWRHWPDDSILMMGIVAAPALVLFNHFTGYHHTPIGLAITSVQLFYMSAVGGLTLRRGVSVLFGLYTGSVFAVGAHLGDASTTLLVTPAVVMPFAVMVAETISWTVSSLRDAQGREAQRLEDIQSLSRRTAQLRGDVPVDRATESIVEMAGELLRGVDARLLSAAHPDDPTWPAGVAEGRAKACAGAGVVTLDLGHDDGVVILPLPGEQGACGVILVRLDRAVDAFTVSLAELVALEAGTALDRLCTIAALTEEASIDQLTGVGNRRLADAALASLAPGDAVMLFDLDGLKPVNDSLGHAAGDAVLRSLADFLVAQQRDGDVVCRLGGDEFVWVARGLGRIAGRVGEQARRRWMHTDPLSTVSIGVAVHEVGAVTGHTMANADSALYQSKHAGGDRVSEHESIDHLTL